MRTTRRARCAAGLAISFLLLAGCSTQQGEDTGSAGSAEETAPALSSSTESAAADEASAEQTQPGEDTGQSADSAAGLPTVSGDTCAVFDEFYQGFPANTESDPGAAAQWFEDLAAQADQQYTGQLRGLAEATRQVAEGHKPIKGLEGQVRGFKERCAHAG